MAWPIIRQTEVWATYPTSFQGVSGCRACDEDHSALPGLTLCCGRIVVPDGAHAHLGSLMATPLFAHRHVVDLDQRNRSLALQPRLSSLAWRGRSSADIVSREWAVIQSTASSLETNFPK